MIVGIGMDLVRSDRIEHLRARYGSRFAERILEAEELVQWQAQGESAEFLAKRFAVKEAAAKALGTGFRDGMRFCEIAIEHNELGAPDLRLTGAAAARARAIGAARHHVSISDERGLALACVILESVD